jgi:hypothetical protein
MLLKPGIRVFYPDSDVVTPSRMVLSSGTRLASEVLTKSRQYAPDAYIPNEPWREPTADEFDCLLACDTPQEPGSVVGIVRIPHEVLAPFEPLRAASASAEPERQVSELRRAPESLHGIDRVLEYVRSLHLANHESTERPSVAVRPSGLITGTFDYSQDRLIGMHLDSWYMQPLDQRHLSPNRICINLGLCDRYFLFINLALRELHELLETSQSNDSSRFEVGRGLGVTFMRTFSSYPVVRLRVAPNEAYIAPTENIIHDGSTVGARHLDLSLTIRGHFRPPVPQQDFS